MTYLAEYAPSGRSSCHWLECEDTQIGKQELRIGKGATQTVWYHVDCFFKYLVVLGPQNLKLKSWEDFWIDRDAVKEEDKQLLNDKIKQCHKDKENKKRKAEEDINDRFAKIAKLDLPPLFTDNLIELVCKFNNKDLLTASLVNKQFNSVARKLLFTREVSVTHKKFYGTTKKQMPFVMQLRKLSFEDRCIFSDYRTETYTQLLAQLTNLQSINFPGDGLFVLPTLKTLTKLTALHIKFNGPINPIGQTSELSELSFDTFKELTDLSLKEVPGTLNSEKLPIQLTSLALSHANIDSLRRFTNLEHLRFIVNVRHMTRMENLMNTEAFELPRLTSLKVTCSEAIDFSKWTRLKALEHYEVREFTTRKLTVPPNLEQLTVKSTKVSLLPVMIPATMKYLSVGIIWQYLRSDHVYNLLRSVDERCHINLVCSDFANVPEDIMTRPNLTLEISSSSYGSVAWGDMMKFFSGPLPERLHIHFSGWRNCRYKPSLLEKLQLLETKTRLLVDYKG